MKLQINWIGNDNNGCLVVNRPNQIEIRTVEELVEYIRDNHQELESTSLELLGSIAFFISIREYGRGEPGTILNRAERALDSFYMVLPDKGSNDRLEAGLETLRSQFISV